MSTRIYSLYIKLYQKQIRRTCFPKLVLFKKTKSLSILQDTMLGRNIKVSCF